MPRVFCLTIHADYACRHAGACCRAGWPIPLEPPFEAAIDEAVRARRLILPLHAESSSACVYLEPADAHGAGGCAIHRQLGREYKPPSCRHFPVIALLDARGVSLTLSHFCPTAASLLFRTDVTLGITESPASFRSHEEYEGLDATHVLPPLLRPGMLWDYDGYTAWEHHAVALLARDGLIPEHALDVLARLASDVERWSPADGKLREHVIRAFAALPQRSDADSRWGDQQAAVCRYLAARLFASWVPYRAQRLATLVEDVANAHRILSEEAARPGVPLLDAIRATDLRIVHSAA